MPTYRFRDLKTGKTFDKFMSMTELDQYLANNKSIEQTVGDPPAVCDSVRIGVTKPDSSFRSLLKHIKKKHRGSTIRDR